MDETEARWMYVCIVGMGPVLAKVTEADPVTGNRTISCLTNVNLRGNPQEKQLHLMAHTMMLAIDEIEVDEKGISWTAEVKPALAQAAEEMWIALRSKVVKATQADISALNNGGGQIHRPDFRRK